MEAFAPSRYPPLAAGAVHRIAERAFLTPVRAHRFEPIEGNTLRRSAGVESTATHAIVRAPRIRKLALGSRRSGSARNGEEAFISLRPFCKDLRAYTVLMVSDLVMITKTGNGRITNLVVDRATGQPAINVNITAVTKEGEKAHSKTDQDGIAELNITPPRDGDLTIIARSDRDVAVNAVRGRFSADDQWTGYVYTDRPVYRPGHTVPLPGRPAPARGGWLR